MTEYERWHAMKLDDPDLTEELNAIEGNPEEINDRFYRELEFGTGGLRGVIGAGTNRINIYTVRKATQGLANYLNKKTSHASVAIAYDSRIKSDVFAKAAAEVLAVTSDTESSSLVAIEAQTCGTRCVLSAGVPKESILLTRTQRLKKNATSEEWCKALLNDSYENAPIASVEDYEVHNMSKKMKEIYLKYYSVYEENKNANTK